MKNSRSLVGLSILAGGMSFVGSASALDLVIDASYESSTNNITGFIGTGGNANPGLDGGWTSFTTYTYSADYTRPGPAGSGQVYLRPYSPNQIVQQTNSLTRALTPAQIDASQGSYTVSAWFCTYRAQNDYSELRLQFLDGSFNGIGSPVLLGGQAFVAALGGGGGLRFWGQDTKVGSVPAGARYAAITTESFALVNLPDGYVDLVSLNVVAGNTPVQISSVPANNSSNVSPGVVITTTLIDGTTALNTNSIQFSFDGSPVTPTIQKTGNTTTVQYDPPGLLTSLSSHTYRVAFNNSGGATPNTTNNYSFTVAPWLNLNIGAPIHLQNFDAIAEGALPAGWSVTNYTDPITAGNDLNDVLSDSYLNWVVISRNRLVSSLISSNADFALATNVAPNQVVNNALVTNLISSNFIFAVSDRAPNQIQVQYLYTSAYNLSGQNNVYLSFNSIYIQNQDNIASVEYSIDGGTTWLPGLYMLDGADILLNNNIDASNTFARVYPDVADLVTGDDGGGYYGQFIGVNSNQWSTLGPYIQPRLDDDSVDSMRVEVVRLPLADNQASVRFRFAMAGTWSWYFGIDNFGLYGIPTTAAPLVGSPTPASQTVLVGDSPRIDLANPLGIGPMSYQWRRNGVNLPGRTNQFLGFPIVQAGDAGTYDVVVTNPGGSVTSALPASVLNVINPAVFVTGQWDFTRSNLVATCGLNMEYFDTTVSNDTTFGTTTSFGLPDINGQPTTVMHYVPSQVSWGGYKLFHGAAPNGGGAYVNQYTLIIDYFIPSSTLGGWHSLWQTDTSNGSDGDLFIDNTGDGIGISGIYEGFVSYDQWHRIAVGIDLSGPAEAPLLTKFIDGVKVGHQTAGLSETDGRFSLDPFALLFADNDGDNAEAYVSSVQFSNGRRPDAFIAALGGPSASKIPGCILAVLEGGNVIIRWTGGVPLQSADSITGTWSTVQGATSPYTVPVANAKFYRPQIP